MAVGQGRYCTTMIEGEYGGQAYESIIMNVYCDRLERAGF
jgi:hypothetical protein